MVERRWVLFWSGGNRLIRPEKVDEEPLIPRHVTVDTLPPTELEKSDAPPSQQDDSRAAAATSAKVWTRRLSRWAVLACVVLCIALFALSRPWPTITTHGLALTSCLRRSWLDPEQDLTTWIRAERKFATKMMLRNIGPIAGAKEGLVIASPSWGQYEDEPDYYVIITPPSTFQSISDTAVHVDTGQRTHILDAPRGLSSCSVSPSMGRERVDRVQRRR